MDALTEQLMGQLAGVGVSQISRKLGVNEQTANAALSAALPLLVSALAKNASQPAGAQALHQALVQDHDGSVLDDISGLVKNPQAVNAAGILKHVLGGQQPVIAKGLSQGTGLDGQQVGQLLQIAAPLVMGALGQQQRKAGLDPNSLSTYLGNQQQKSQQSNPDMMNALNTLLDSDQDGSAVDDVLGTLGKLFGGK